MEEKLQHNKQQQQIQAQQQHQQEPPASTPPVPWPPPLPAEYEGKQGVSGEGRPDVGRKNRLDGSCGQARLWTIVG